MHRARRCGAARQRAKAVPPRGPRRSTGKAARNTSKADGPVSSKERVHSRTMALRGAIVGIEASFLYPVLYTTLPCRRMQLAKEQSGRDQRGALWPAAQWMARHLAIAALNARGRRASCRAVPRL